MRFAFSVIKVLLLIALVAGVVTFAVPMFLLGAYCRFMWDCVLLGVEAYNEARKFFLSN